MSGKVVQLRGLPTDNLVERFEWFREEYGEPTEAVMILLSGDYLYAQAFTGANGKLSKVVGAIELGKRKIINDWYESEEPKP